MKLCCISVAMGIEISGLNFLFETKRQDFRWAVQMSIAVDNSLLSLKFIQKCVHSIKSTKRSKSSARSEKGGGIVVQRVEHSCAYIIVEGFRG